MRDRRRRSGSTWALAIHGGSGVKRDGELTAESDAALRAELSATLDAGAGALARGGTSLDAVEDAVRRLEDSPLFNAGRGSVLNERGECELEASIMDGRTLDAGAVAVLRGIRNPISLARLVMERSPHLFLQGEGALAFAASCGMDTVDPAYFRTAERWKALEEARRGKVRPGAAGSEPGTVGAVALDLGGNLAAATSTGGLTNKLVGRVGDSAVIGAGTYAGNSSCAVSCTGQGEYFIRATAARDVSAQVEYGGKDAKAAAGIVIGRIARIGGRGGIMVVDRSGEVVFAFNTEVMLRGSIRQGKPKQVGIFAQEDA